MRPFTVGPAVQQAVRILVHFKNDKFVNFTTVKMVSDEFSTECTSCLKNCANLSFAPCLSKINPIR